MRPAPTRMLYVTAIGLSAFLLFTLELLAGRLVLPAYGGAPAVWTTVLCFFTGTVFLGYLYAHVVATRLPRRVASFVHIAVAALALAAAVSGAHAPVAAGGATGMPEAVDLLVALIALVAGPAFLLSTTTPLLSAWYAEGERDPWWLYAVSNGASLFGLLSYPFLIDPLGITVQRVGAAALTGAVAVLVCAIALLRLRQAAVVPAAPEAGSVASMPAQAPGASAPAATPVSPLAPVHPARLGLRRQSLWLLAALAPTGLLAATTTQLTTDQVSAPLLWIGPLAVFLLSFVIAFSERGRRVLPAVERLLPAAATLVWMPFVVRIDWPPLLLITLMLGSYAIVATALHGRLALDRPAGVHLTRFYLIVSLGGVLATAFTALAAPLLFNDVYEFPLFLVIGLVAASALPGPALSRRSGPGAVTVEAGRRALPYAIACAVAIALVARSSVESAALLGVVAVAGLSVIVVGHRIWSLAIASAFTVALLTLVFVPTPLLRERTFFGITEVRVSADSSSVSEIHGTTLHGIQYRDERGHEPTAYFVSSGPLGQVFADLRERTAGARIGIVGLGAGTVMTYARPGDSVTYFEIDRTVARIARDERYFTFIADAPVTPRIVIGDGRLTVAKQPTGRFDLLMADAFSSDAVPVHLLTVEAVREYARTLKPDGVLVFQLTNRHFDLAPAVAATARQAGLSAVMLHYDPPAEERERLHAQSSTWLVAGSPEAIARFERAGWQRPEEGPVLTDEYSDILRLLKSGGDAGDTQ